MGWTLRVLGGSWDLVSMVAISTLIGVISNCKYTSLIIFLVTKSHDTLSRLKDTARARLMWAKRP